MAGRLKSSEPQVMMAQTLLDSIRGGNADQQRRAIAKAITLLESTRADHRSQADALLNQLSRQWEHEFESLCQLLAVKEASHQGPRFSSCV